LAASPADISLAAGAAVELSAPVLAAVVSLLLHAASKPAPSTIARDIADFVTNPPTFNIHKPSFK
jgi:hypothetical protein